MRAKLLLLGVVAPIVLTACGDGANRGATTDPTATSSRGPATAVAAADLVIGDCISGVVIGDAERRMTESVEVVDCESVHDLEVFATFELSAADFDDAEGGAYPGEQRVVREADEGCAARLAELGLEDELGLIAIWPTNQSWTEGDRGVTCAAFSKDRGPFEGRRVLGASASDGDGAGDGDGS